MTLVKLLCIGCWVASAAIADDFDAALPQSEFNDSLMATPEELQDLRQWAAAAFAGTAPVNPEAVTLNVLRQDHSVLGFGQSCIDTPIRIGTKTYEHGLGTHAHSMIGVVAPAGAQRFQAAVGIDNNDDTLGTRGSADFIVESLGRQLFRSATVHGGEEAVSVDVELNASMPSIKLIVDATADGVSHDQADWADARFVMADGSVRWLDEHQSRLLFLNTEVPFSFNYGGASSHDLLKDWSREVSTETREDRTNYHVSWKDAKTGLTVSAEAAVYTGYPAVDWVLYFENQGTEDTPLLEDIRALDVHLRTGYQRHPAVLHELNGDACGENTFLPKTTSLYASEKLHLAPTGGRSSSISAFPFFNFGYGNQGLIAAIGWTGQWAADFDRAEAGPTRLRAGMEHTRLRLHPGERIRTPRIVLLPWEGDRVRAHNLFRRLVLFKYAPRINGQVPRLPIALQTYDRYNSRPGWATQAGQLQAVETAHQLGCDTYWLDAAWFPGNFPNGVGNWFHKPAEFPNGLKPIGDACAQRNMRFVLWFEPERVAPGSQIATEHPEFVLGGEKGGLFKLGDPAARRWLTDLLSQRIDEYGVTIYRNDFNMDPLSFWREHDTPEREGMTEIRYVEGLYEMWDELRAQHPGLLIDNCSSGGRRIDIEMCARSVPFWRSDTNCTPGHADWNQLQSAALMRYVPLNLACAWTPGPYEMRSAATGGLLCQFAYMDENFPFAEAQRLITEARKNTAYWYGDFYLLTSPTTAPDQFMAWQLHRPDLDAGIVLAFRRRECNYLGLILGPRQLQSAKQYSVRIETESGAVTEHVMSGEELMSDFALRLNEYETSLLVRYAVSGREGETS